MEGLVDGELGFEAPAVLRRGFDLEAGFGLLLGLLAGLLGFDVVLVEDFVAISLYTLRGRGV